VQKLPEDFPSERIHPAVSLKLSLSQGALSLDYLHVPLTERGAGLAKSALELVCGYADLHGLKLVTLAGEPLLWDQESLVRFYERFGFRRSRFLTKDFCVRLSRKPAS